MEPTENSGSNNFFIKTEENVDSSSLAIPIQCEPPKTYSGVVQQPQPPQPPPTRSIESSTATKLRLKGVGVILFGGAYFKIIKTLHDTNYQRKMRGILAQCMHCPNELTIKGSLSVSSNFIQHLKTKHPLIYVDFLHKKESKTSMYKKKKKDEVAAANESIAYNNMYNACYSSTALLYGDEKMATNESESSVTIKSEAPSSTRMELEEEEFNDSSGGGGGLSGVGAILFDGHFFQIVQRLQESHYQRKMGGIVAACMICPNNTTLRGSFKVTSNFIYHLKHKHPMHYIEYTGRKIAQRLIKRRDSIDEHNEKTHSKHYLELSRSTDNSNMTQDDDSNLEEVLLDIDKNNYLMQEMRTSAANYAVAQHSTNSEVIGEHSLLFNGAYFEILQESDHGEIVATCTICANGVKIEGSLAEAACFIHHLRKQHPQQYSEYCRAQHNVAQCDADDDVDDDDAVENKEKSARKVVHKTKQNIDNKILNFLIDNYLPPSIVARSSFCDLFKGTNIEVQYSQASLGALLNDQHAAYITRLQSTLAGVTYCCATADLWWDGPKSYFAHSCHWIDSHTLKRHSAALACRRLSGSISFAQLQSCIVSIQRQFQLTEEKLVGGTVIDSGHNLCSNYQQMAAAAAKFGQLSEAGTAGCVQPFQFEDLSDRLPRYTRCYSNALQQLATCDFLSVLETNEVAHSLHKQAFTRCFTVWQLCQHSNLSISNISLQIPATHCWNSVLESVKQLLKNLQQFKDLCESLNQPTLDWRDIEYLENYCTLMTPFANAFSFLDDNIYYGYFIATLVSLKVKLRKISQSKELKHLDFVCQQLECKLFQRFQNYFELHDDTLDLIVAAVTCPSIKLRIFHVLRETATHYSVESIKELVIRYAEPFRVQSKCSTAESATLQEEKANDFLDFGEIQSTPTSQCVLRTELESYLSDLDTSFESLQRYPIIRQLFLRYNTLIPSAVPVERLFSFGDLMKNPQRQKLTDVEFEKFVLFRAQKNFN